MNELIAHIYKDIRYFYKNIGAEWPLLQLIFSYLSKQYSVENTILPMFTPIWVDYIFHSSAKLSGTFLTCTTAKYVRSHWENGTSHERITILLKDYFVK